MPSWLLVMSLAIASVGADQCAANRVARDSQELWPLTLADAIRIAAFNSENARTLQVSNYFIGGCFEPSPPEMMGLTDSPDKQESWIVIAPLDHDQSLGQFRSEITALVRTVEDKYWALHERTVELWARQKAVELVQKALVRRKREHRCHGIALAEERLERFRLDAQTTSAERTAAEWRLRTSIGCPIADGRTIVPATMPVDRNVALNRDACLALIDSNNSATSVRQAFNRCVEQVDDRYQTLLDASKAQALAQNQLCQQYVDLDEADHSIDGYLDAIKAYVAASSRKVHAKSSYNSALSALEETKGTLLELRSIEIRPSPRKLKRMIQRRSDEARTTPAARQ